jgi:hypothetical protein
MSELKDLYKQLELYSQNFDNWDNIEKFLETAREIVSIGDISSFPILLSYFDDQHNTDFVLEELSNAIEGFGNTKYIKGMLQNLHIMFPKARKWAADLIVIILNSPNTLKILKSNIHLTDKAKLLEVLDVIYQRTVKHKQVIEELRKILENTGNNY